LFIWSKKSGQRICKGEPLGEILSPHGDRTRKIIARKDGYILGHNNASVVNVGDALFNIGYEPTDF
jgi:predicted deacylase